MPDRIPSGGDSSVGLIRTDTGLQDEALSDVEESVATADEFIVYGKASVEVYDDDVVSQKIEMEAFEETLDQFFAQGGPISFQHKDVIVGEAKREHTLESPATVEIDDETYSFEAGDTLETEVRDDSLFLVADIYGRSDTAGTDASVQTRLGAYHGDLDGFSVTIRNKAYKNTAQGQLIEDIDFHSVTVGTDEQIKNEGSQFDVAEFKLDEILNRVSLNTQQMEYNILKALRSKSTEAMGEETIEHALTETRDIAQSAEVVADGAGVEEVQETAQSKLDTLVQEADDSGDLVARLVDMTGLDPDEVEEAVDEMMDDMDENMSGETMDDVDMNGGHMSEEKAEGSVEDHAEMIADLMGDTDVEDVMDALEGVDGEVDGDMESKATDESIDQESVEEMVDEKLDEALDGIDEQIDSMEETVAERVSERISEKLERGSTPDADETPTDDGSRNLLAEW